MATTKILVLGAGELGTAILTSLSQLAPPHTSITVLLRPSTINSTNPSKLTELNHLKYLNIAFLPGDISTSTPSSLSSLFQPFDLIINCLGFASGPSSQIKITKAVLDAKVKRFVPWQFGVDYDIVGRDSAQELWDEQLDVRDLLREQEGTEWIVVSTGMFTSFLFEQFFGVVDFGEEEGEVTVRALGGWENRVTVTTPDDIGKLTAMAVFETPNLKNQIIYTAGETISYARVAEIVEKLVGEGRKVNREVWSVEKLREDLKADPEDAVKKYRVVFAEGKGVSWDEGKTFNVQRGIEVTDVEGFAREKFGAIKK
ncbi:related to NmrA-like family protein [Phialocephala subalpina]|uniref:Related to NmrA-like family protein n=1 Tax=Phialocephala subalpina TaxID=576137 RepID=A0A1L7X6R8_9HELO|nr:related to NmrA-like family protein [Phialocephala subalpina]